MSTVSRAVPTPPELIGRWTAVFEEGGFRPRLLELADRFPEERSLEVPFGVIDSIDTPLADLLLERPTELLAAGTQAMRELLPIAGPEADGFRLRIVGLPVTAHRSIRSIRETDLNRFVAIDGIVRKVTEVRPQIREAVFQCAACSQEFIEEQEEGALALREPLECPESQGGCGKPAGRTRFRLLPERSTYVDSQRIEIQESPETLRGGAHPQGVPVLFTEDLTGRVIPGNRIVANGILKSLQRNLPGRSGSGRATTFDLSILANSIESKQVDYAEIEISEEEDRFFQGFRGDPTIVDKIVLSLAPTIKGMEQEKEAIALQLFGGVEKHHADGIRVRGDINVLLIGDPGSRRASCSATSPTWRPGGSTPAGRERPRPASRRPPSRTISPGAGGCSRPGCWSSRTAAWRSSMSWTRCRPRTGRRCTRSSNSRPSRSPKRGSPPPSTPGVPCWRRPTRSGGGSIRPSRSPSRSICPRPCSPGSTSSSRSWTGPRRSGTAFWRPGSFRPTGTGRRGPRSGAPSRPARRSPRTCSRSTSPTPARPSGPC